MNVGKLIIILGVDGAGKSTCLRHISTIMDARNITYLCLERKGFQEYAEEFQVSQYICKYMEHLGIILWGAHANDPVTELSDNVWLYMHTIWYEVFQTYILEPALHKYNYVFLDSWFYKIMARFLVNKRYQTENLFAVFGKLIKGDMGIMLDTDIQLCLERKSVLSQGEVGRHHIDLTETNPQRRFVEYQMKVRQELRTICTQNQWWICQCTYDWTETEYQQLVEHILHIGTNRDMEDTMCDICMDKS